MFYSHWILRSICVNHHPILNGKTLERIPTGTHFLVAPQILLLYPCLSRKRFIQIFLLSLPGEICFVQVVDWVNHVKPPERFCFLNPPIPLWLLRLESPLMSSLRRFLKAELIRCVRRDRPKKTALQLVTGSSGPCWNYGRVTWLTHYHWAFQNIESIFVTPKRCRNLKDEILK